MLHININKTIQQEQNIFTTQINVDLNKGDFLAISGESGSGKTTLLRILAGLESTNGLITLDEKIWNDKSIHESPQNRQIGFMFQDYALFENMTAIENLLYVSDDIKLATRLLNITNMFEFRNNNVTRLSGGQKQRISLCRALMNRPRLLLLDEPFSALDFETRNKLQNEIMTLHKEFDMTTLMISHDSAEIYKLANKVIVLNEGKIVKEGTPKDVLLRMTGSQKFSFEGEILELKKVDVINVAILSIGQQLVEVVISSSEAMNFKVGQKVSISTKAFSPILSAL